MKNNISIILVSPQKGENIGFVARAMLNFGLSDLRIVSPRDGWPNSSADATAVKAISILENAKIYDTFHDAISDLHYTYVTTARNRNINKESISSRDISNNIKKNISSGYKNIGIVFGPERSGVDNDVLSMCNKIINIPIGDQFASLNLGMAAGIICYELSKIFISHKDYVITEIASQGEVDNLVSRLDKMLQVSNFYQIPEKRNIMLQNLTSMIKRIDLLTSNEVNTWIGIFRSLYEYGNKN